MKTQSQFSPTFLLRTKSGKAVCRQGGKASLEGKTIFSIMEVSSSPRNREYNLRKAEQSLGEPCEWVKGPMAEYCAP